ncbi:MBL fold metallo-hydrolase [Alteriqipengyuania lutimaris]|uniref:MBL fold metallo-hydrolase n=1 Tax=Alteriqipengyuania lutimaris TaxID=1538146 RepID=A0A395LKB7_9SPHN|nr:MBL fold metallo-hydrolase [Alteriqipengyuania lutimaris]MBB3033569.1 glyoxylase-like metal-dependent hydrolase (beta-lactamase superfamily II) [Alteriqipengyuania lutimaris]RDS77428.1 MBL fold metallo-hydrolase [Alteriqipengyuania lutimaris]
MVDIPPRPWPVGTPERPEPLVTRVLAPNPSPYTFTGTQTYLVGTGEDRAVIDPGPAEVEHLDAILAAAGDAKISAILCTHTHRDHSPAAAPLAEKTGAPVMGCAKLVIADNGPRADEAFDTTYEPDRVMADGDTVSGDGWTLRAVATPGHTSNHLCFALEESGALFTGDHVMGWSTSVIVPPDGDMSDYMESLAKLYEREDKVYYPAHGKPVDRPQQLVRSMIGHRRQRERQILKVLGDAPRSLPEFIPIMYKGLDPRLEKAAQMSVHAHLIDLERRNLVTRSGERWAAI